jgi:aspartyl protease
MLADGRSSRGGRIEPLVAELLEAAARDGAVVNIVSRAGCGGLGAGLVLFGLLGGCSTSTSPTAPDQDLRRAILWAAATECADGKQASLKVARVDNDGQVHVTVLPGGQPAVPAFTACFNEKAPAKLAAAGRATSPARILDPRVAEEPAGGRPSPRVTSVAIQTIHNRFLVPVVLNETQRATLLLDTGANITVLTPQLARRAGIEVPTGAGASKSKARMASGQEVEVSLIRVKSMMVGSARIDNLQVAVYEIGVLDSTATSPLTIDGFLGADFLGRFTMTIDPQAGRLTLQLADGPAK